MKFGKRMNDEMVEAWREHYVSYKRLKQFVRGSEFHGEQFNTALFKLLRDELTRAERHLLSLIENLSVGHRELVSAKNVHGISGGASEGIGGGSILTVEGDESGSNSNYSFSALNRSGYGKLHDADSHGEAARTSWKNLFLGFIGDKSRSSHNRSMQTDKTAYIDWFTTARRTIRFADLNLEAIHKALKKLNKWRKEEGDFTEAVHMEINMSSLSMLMPRLQSMVDDVKQAFQTKFDDEHLEQFESVTMAKSELWHAKWGWVVFSFALGVFVLNAPILQDAIPAHKCLALFSIVISMWITEAIPFFCTAMLIPLLAVPLMILADPMTQKPADPVVGARVIMGRIFDHVQILVLGGLTMAKALAKVQLEAELTQYLHRLTAHRPNFYLLGVMVLACGLCLFVSNVASPLLVLGVIQSTLWEFPVEAPEAPKGILLGLAIACNLGGMLSPIASPQNAVAMQTDSLHNVSFAGWVLVAAPIVFTLLFVAWALILAIWKPFQNVRYIPIQVSSKKTKPEQKEVLLVICVCVLTIALWCLPPSLIFGDTGIIALIPIVVFFGVGVLKKDDFNSLPWHLMFLLAGGNMMGQCAKDSKLLEIVSDGIRHNLSGMTAFQMSALIIVMVCIVTTFVSHTVAAMIMLPVISAIGKYLPKQHEGHGVWIHTAITQESLIFSSVFMCSGAMAFPITSFPNVNSLLAEDENGQPYLKARDFLGIGGLVTSLCLVFLILSCAPLVNTVSMLSSTMI